jgi:aspartyl-tRNA(Asn)/glutamyl-tRNA(Gln) amidotransferase subunit C
MLIVAILSFLPKTNYPNTTFLENSNGVEIVTNLFYNYPMLTKEEIVKIAALARIELTESEVEKFQKDLSAVLEYVDALQKVDTTGLEIVSQVTGLENVQRPDVAVSADNREEILKNAPEIKDGYYKVKAIL